MCDYCEKQIEAVPVIKSMCDYCEKRIGTVPVMPIGGVTKKDLLYLCEDCANECLTR